LGSRFEACPVSDGSHEGGMEGIHGIHGIGAMGNSMAFFSGLTWRHGFSMAHRNRWFTMVYLLKMEVLWVFKSQLVDLASGCWKNKSSTAAERVQAPGRWKNRP